MLLVKHGIDVHTIFQRNDTIRGCEVSRLIVGGVRKEEDEVENVVLLLCFLKACSWAATEDAGLFAPPLPRLLKNKLAARKLSKHKSAQNTEIRATVSPTFPSSTLLLLLLLLADLYHTVLSMRFRFCNKLHTVSPFHQIFRHVTHTNCPCA